MLRRIAKAVAEVWLGILEEPLAVLALAVLAVAGQLNLRAVGEPALADRQLLMDALGGALLLLLAHLRGKDWAWAARLGYLAAVASLVAVDMRGAGALGAQRWLALGPLVMQPSEVAKVALLMVLADVLGVEKLRSGRALLAIALAAIPMVLTWREPDLSTTVLLAVLLAGALVVARAPLRVFLAGAALLAAATPVVLRMLKPYQLERLQAALGDGGAAGYSVLQANIALGAGGMYGLVRDPMHEVMSLYLPARNTDLAFSSLVQQWGMTAGLVAVAATLLLLLRLVAMARRAATPRGAVFAGSLAVLFAAESSISILGNLGRIPLAGVPYPLLSYGGTAAVAHIAALGLAVSTRPDPHRPLWRMRLPWKLPVRFQVPLALGLALLTAASGWLAWHDQKGFAVTFEDDAVAQMTRCGVLPAARGTIEDRHGAPLAINQGVETVYVAPGLLVRDPKATRAVADAFKLPAAGFQMKLLADREKVVEPVGDLPPEAAQRLAHGGLPGVVAIPSNVRQYPAGAVTGPILGFTGIVGADDPRHRYLRSGAIVGRAGIEQVYDSVLRGADGELCVYVDPANVAVAQASVVMPQPGRTLRLSLDLNLQRFAFERLTTALRPQRGQPTPDIGSAIVLDGRNGQVLALASVPSYDDNVFSRPLDAGAVKALGAGPGNPMLEHSTQIAMPPGSTFKLVVAAADAVHRAIPPEQVIPTGYTFAYGGAVLHGWGSLPPQNLTQAIAWSNDVYFYKLAVQLGPERIADVAHQLGVGDPTGIDLPTESAGVLMTPADVEQGGGTWYPAVTAMMGIGQGFTAATPLQVARWTAAVSTGTLVVPRLGLAAGDGPELERLPAAPVTVLPFADALGPVRDGLRLAVTQGTATMLMNLPQPAGGKTGTAEDPSAPGGVDAWFTSVAPVAAAPSQVVVTVSLRGGGEGHLNAEPVARDIWGTFYSGPTLDTPTTYEPEPPARRG